MSTALLVVDVQRALVAELPSPRRAAFLQVLSGLLERARAAKVPVVYVRHADEELVAATPGWEIAEEIAPRPPEPIVEKRRSDAFVETDLADVLAGLGVDHIVVCGMQTEFCIDASVRGGAERGYRVTLVEDGHATYSAPGATEDQIRDRVNRGARELAALVPASGLFAGAATSAS